MNAVVSDLYQGTYKMSHSICKGTVLSTKKPCDKRAIENGLCGRHQEQFFILDAGEKGLQICRMFNRGCRNYLSSEDISAEYKTCETCRKQLLKKTDACQHEGCTFSTESGHRFCGKHARDLFREHAATAGIRYCNIDRGCASILEDGETVCKLCLNKKTALIATELEELRTTILSCLKCQTRPKTIGHFCETCDPTIYKCSDAVSKRTSQEVWRDTCASAEKRTYLFVLTLTEAQSIIIRPCGYCGRFSNTQFNGIDRVDNAKGYIVSNVIPCCAMCNIMKNSMPEQAFFIKLQNIVAYQTDKIPMNESTLMTWDIFRTKKTITYITYKNNAINKRHLVFDLTKEEYIALQNGRCYLCGIPTSLVHRNGIDRIDSSTGYTPENCKTCCTHCNIMKSDFPCIPYLDQCSRILAYRHYITHTVSSDATLTKVTRLSEKTEKYTSYDMYTLLKDGRVDHLIEWAKRNGKSAMFMEGMRAINIKNDIAHVITEIQHQMEIERTRAYQERHATEGIKHYSAAKVYATILNGQADKFVKWYETTFDGVSPSFHDQFNTLCTQLQVVKKEEALEMCRDFLKAETSRRKSIKATELKQELKGSSGRKSWTAKSIVFSPVVSSSDIPKNEIFLTPAPIPELAETPKCEDEPIVVSAAPAAPYITPKQWKANSIYDAIRAGHGDQYKKYCEEHNDLSKCNWDERWSTFHKTVKDAPSFDSVNTHITEFIVSLREGRHAILLEKTRKDVLDRDDRMIWRKEVVLRAYLSGRINQFKEYNEIHSNQSDDSWNKRWTTFLEKLTAAKCDEERLDTIHKFQQNLRMIRYKNSISKN